jgi:hypothetical protein
MTRYSNILHENKINIISNFFNISNNAAKYLYNRRQLSYPYVNTYKCLEWSIFLQNALVKLDTVSNFKWENLKFGYEYEMLQLHNINILDEKNVVYCNKADNKEWIIVKSKKMEHDNKKVLKMMGFI